MKSHSPSPSFVRFVITQFSFGGSFLQKTGEWCSPRPPANLEALLVNGLASLFATCILDLEISRGSLSVDFRSWQLVTVDKNVERNMNTENSELPRPSTHLTTPMSKFETEAILVTVT